MSALARDLAAAMFIVPLFALSFIAWTQTSESLQNRIPKADPRKYDAVQEAKDWKNPYLIVRREGVEILGITAVGKQSRSIRFPES